MNLERRLCCVTLLGDVCQQREVGCRAALIPIVNKNQKSAMNIFKKFVEGVTNITNDVAEGVSSVINEAENVGSDAAGEVKEFGTTTFNGVGSLGFGISGRTLGATPNKASIEQQAYQFIHENKTRLQEIVRELKSLQQLGNQGPLANIERHINNGDDVQTAQPALTQLGQSSQVNNATDSAKKINSNYKSMTIQASLELNLVYGGTVATGFAIPIGGVDALAVPVTSLEWDIGVQLGLTPGITFGFFKDIPRKLAGESRVVSVSAAFIIGANLSFYFNENWDGLQGVVVTAITGTGLEFAFHGESHTMYGIAGPAGYIATKLPTLIKESGQHAIYLIDDKDERRWVPDPLTLKNLSSLGYEPGSVVTVGQADVLSYEEGQKIPSLKDGNVYQGVGRRKVFIMEEQKKRWISGAAIFSQMGLNQNDIQKISAADLDRIPTGTKITSV